MFYRFVMNNIMDGIVNGVVNRQRITLWLCQLAVILPVFAQADDNLYRATQLVTAPATEESRKQAMQAALQQVVQKLVGSPTAAQATELQSVYSQAPQYVQQFRYQTVSVPTPVAASVAADLSVTPPAPLAVTPPLPAEAVAPPPASVQEQLWVEFDASGVNQLLADRGLPVWLPPRPSTLVWLAIEDEQQQRVLLNSEYRPEWSDWLQQGVEPYALPIILPLMDLTDQAQVHFSDISGDFFEPIAKASLRYQPTLVLLGKLQFQGGQWLATWKLHQQDKILHSWQQTGGEVQRLLADSMHTLVTTLHQHFAPKIVAQHQGTVVLYVADVNSLSDYLAVQQYLQSLSALKKLQTQRMETTNVTFQAELYGSLEDLQRSIGLGQHLSPLPASTEPAANQTLYFKWLP